MSEKSESILAHEKLGGKIDKALQQLKDHNDILDNHEHRLDKVEDKVFTATTNP